MYKIINLDKRICDIEDNADNPETYREFIEDAEKYLHVEKRSLNKITDAQLTEYIDFLDFLIEKEDE